MPAEDDSFNHPPRALKLYYKQATDEKSSFHRDFYGAEVCLLVLFEIYSAILLI